MKRGKNVQQFVMCPLAFNGKYFLISVLPAWSSGTAALFLDVSLSQHP